MLCKKCGAKLPDDSKFCGLCGTKIMQESETNSNLSEPTIVYGDSATVKSRTLTRKGLIVIIVSVILLCALGIAAALLLLNGNSRTKVDDILVAAEKYLVEMNYEQAIVEYEKIIAIEPMNVEAYIGMADAYIGLGKYDKAIDILETGYNLTGDERIHQKLDEIDKILNPVISSSQSSSSSTTSSAPDESDPRADKYSTAVKLMDEGNYEAALSIFVELDGYLDSDVLMNECKYLFACSKMNAGLYSDAITLFSELGDYKESIIYIGQCNQHIKYNNAVSLMNEGKYVKAMSEFEQLGSFLDSESQYIECKYQYAIQLMNSGNYSDAKALFVELGNYKKSKSLLSDCEDKLYNFTVPSVVNQSTISVGGFSTIVCVKNDGTVAYDWGIAGATSESIANWKNIVGVGAGWNVAYGLTSSGKVVGAGGNYKQETSSWNDVIKIDVKDFSVIALHSNGTVSSTDYGGETKGWRYIIDVARGNVHTVGLKSDGTVVAAGANESGQCDVSGWSDVVAIEAGSYSTVGLRSNGTVLYAGSNETVKRTVSSWKNVISVATSDNYVVAVKSDGSVLFAGQSTSEYSKTPNLIPSVWNNLVEVSIYDDTVIGLKSNGSVVVYDDMLEILGGNNSTKFTGIKLP